MAAETGAARRARLASGIAPPRFDVILGDTIAKYADSPVHGECWVASLRDLDDMFFTDGVPRSVLGGFSDLVSDAFVAVVDAWLELVAGQGKGGAHPEVQLFTAVRELYAQPDAGLGDRADVATRYGMGALTHAWRQAVWSALNAAETEEAADDGAGAAGEPDYHEPTLAEMRPSAFARLQPLKQPDPVRRERIPDGYQVPYGCVFGHVMHHYERAWQLAAQRAMAGGSTHDILRRRLPAGDAVAGIVAGRLAPSEGNSRAMYTYSALTVRAMGNLSKKLGAGIRATSVGLSYEQTDHQRRADAAAALGAMAVDGVDVSTASTSASSSSSTSTVAGAGIESSSPDPVGDLTAHAAAMHVDPA